MGSVATAPKRCYLKGSPKDIGFQHGQQLGEEIRSQMSVYEAMFKRTSKLDWAAVREVAEGYRATVARLTPTIYAEMEGIAEGCGEGVDILDVVALNSRSEIALGLFSDGCSSMGWRRSKGGADGAGDDVVLAQNWDWTARVKKNCALLTIDQQQSGLPTVYMMTEAGLVGKIGFNSASLGVCQNAIRARPTDPAKLPYHVVCRLALNSTSVAAAVSTIQALGSTASTQHLLLADPSGPLSCEWSPLGDAFIEPDAAHGLVCHTNHLLANTLVDEPPWLPGSPIRLAQMNKLTAALADEVEAGTTAAVDAAVLRERVFSDTFNAPQAICCHEDPSRPIETRSSTLVNIVMTFAKDQKPTAEVVWGQPGSGLEGEVIHLP